MRALFANLTLALFGGDHVGVDRPETGPASRRCSKFWPDLSRRMTAYTHPARPIHGSDMSLRSRASPPASASNKSCNRPSPTPDVILTKKAASSPSPEHRHLSQIRNRASIPSPEAGAKRLAITQALLLRAGRAAHGRADQPFGCRGHSLAGATAEESRQGFSRHQSRPSFLESIATRMVELNRCYPEGRFEAKGRYSDF